MKARFLLSTFSDYPHLKDPRGTPLPEVALVGRSNVGKSSLINHFFQERNLAKTSATPGKTRLLNFFCVDEKFIWVDLPGYGYAKAPKEEIAKWSIAIHTYLHTSKHLKLLLLLIDSRRDFGADDIALAEWANAQQIPLLVILTKTDKLSAGEKVRLLRKYPDAIPYSITNSNSRQILEKRIREILWA